MNEGLRKYKTVCVGGEDFRGCMPEAIDIDKAISQALDALSSENARYMNLLSIKTIVCSGSLFITIIAEPMPTDKEIAEAYSSNILSRERETV